MDSGKQTEGFRGDWYEEPGEHWVLYTNSVSWNTTSKTNDRRDKMAWGSRKRHLFNLYSKASRLPTKEL